MSNNFLASTLNHPIRIFQEIMVISYASSLMRYISRCQEQHYYHLDLLRLSNDAPHMIEDVGLTKEKVESELAKPFWR